MISFYAIGVFFSILILLLGFFFFTREGNRRRRSEKLLRQQSDRERLVTQIAHQIRQSLNLDEVLATTVREVQLFLQADRVLIYRLWDDGTGSAIHETVLPPYLSILAIAIQQSELYKQLQYLNTQLEQRVQQRTVELANVNASLRDEISERQRTEIALRHTNETLQALVSASPRAIFMLDLEGRVKIWNPAAEQMFGWKEDEVINHPSPIPLDEQLEDSTTIQNSVLQGKTYTRLEMSRFKKDGSAIDIIFSAAPLPDTNGEISGLVAVIADISEQKRQAEQVRLLQSVVVNTNDAVIVTEAESIDAPGPRILYVNEAFTRITGYKPEEVLGKTPRILQGAKTDQAQLQKVRSALSRWESITVEVINYCKDGSEFWNEFSLVPVANAKGWYTHWIAVQRDTTERKQVEQALRQSEERFRSLIENALDIIMILDPDGTIGYVSPSVEKVLGYAVTELVGANVNAFIHPEDLPISQSFPQVTLRDRLTNNNQAEILNPIEFRHRHQDGSWRILEAISQPFADSAATLRVMVNARDITERKRLDEIWLALEREKELSALKTRFFSMASHEFRTPLSTALAAAQVLENSQQEWDNTEKRLRNLHRIQDSVRNMVQLLDDILTINRAETGKLAFNPKSLALEAYCRHFVEEMQLNAGNLHHLTFSCQGKSQHVCLDEKLLQSMLSNLLSNAIKYSPQGGNISLSLQFQSGNLIIKVQDQGIGILMEDQKQLFEPFHRGKNVKTISGTGLGLVVVKKCVDLHQGNISIRSEVGRGTTCVINIPLKSKPFNGASLL